MILFIKKLLLFDFTHLAPKLLDDVVDTLPVRAGDNELLHLVLLAPAPLLALLHRLLDEDSRAPIGGLSLDLVDADGEGGGLLERPREVEDPRLRLQCPLTAHCHRVTVYENKTSLNTSAHCYFSLLEVTDVFVLSELGYCEEMLGRKTRVVLAPISRACDCHQLTLRHGHCILVGGDL